MTYSLTIFKNLFDNKTHRRMDFESWDEFTNLFYKLSKVPKKDKKSAQLISPAIYQPNTTRANKNVVAWGKWAAVDVDDHEFKGDLKNELYSRIGRWSYICYSTASSRLDKPKFRIVFELDRNIEESKIRHFWFALNTELESVGDRQCKDLSRMYYIPADYAGANNFIFSNSGIAIHVDELLSKHPYIEKSHSVNFMDRLPDELKDKIIEYRKSKMENTSVNWSSYHNCPFFPKQLENEYRSISNTGWYHKMYQIMVALAGNAIKKEYPISAQEISKLCRELDMETGNWYANRPLEKEADRAIEYVYRNM
jgi:hypothetical protein